MHTGTITEFDDRGQFGLIDADDGHVVLFNLESVAPAARSCIGVGTRVKFSEEETSVAPRAVRLVPLDCPP